MPTIYDRGDTTPAQDKIIQQLSMVVPSAELFHSFDRASDDDDHAVFVLVVHPVYRTSLEVKVTHDPDTSEAVTVPNLDQVVAWYQRQEHEYETTTVLPWRVQIRSSTVAAFETIPTRAQIHSVLTEGVTLDDIVIRHERVAI